MRGFRGKHTFLTGAASGIGRAIAVALAHEGARLYLVDIDRAGLDSVVRETGAIGADAVAAVCDLADRAQIDATTAQALERWGHFDLLINNAGIAFYGTTESMSAQQWDRLIGVNLIAPIHITRALLPTLLSRPDAHIVNMCSIAGLAAGARLTAYHTSKFGLIGFTEALRAEYARRGLGVTAICPGPVTTSLYESTVSTEAGAKAPSPPAWTCTTPEIVARRTIRAIRRNRRVVLITPMAHGLYHLKRLAPGLLDFVNNFSRKRLLRSLRSRGGAGAT